ncbi:MAG: hypothetical protein KBB54_00625 [Candidatus Pacebacteria bacterium]|nr:hypothetical protein [Candidatus Paceibacterota bacterium]MBP9818759.1 hypothetical protein [Candidatus Paceibacterota bacterium]
MNELVLFGVTGDLAKQKLIPALFKLYKNGELNRKSSFIGFGRKKFTKSDFQNFIEQLVLVGNIDTTNKISSISLNTHDTHEARSFASQWSYVESELDNLNGYKKLASILTTDTTLVYISLPPMYQYQVCSTLVSSGIVVKSKNRRIAFEKPYGFDSISANKLDSFLTRRLRTDQILRVDHYAGKQALVEFEQVARQGIFSDILNSKNIKKIEVRLNESIDVAKRGPFYDQVGALSDVGQNHVLHMLATVLALPEISVAPSNLSELRSSALSILEINKKSILGQYQSFTATPGVREGSTTETFFRIFGKIKAVKSTKVNGKREGKGGKNKSYLNDLSKRWVGLNIEIMGGKALSSPEASITLHTKHSKPVKIMVNGYGSRDAYEQIFIDSFKYNPDRFIDFKQIEIGWDIIEKVKKMASKKVIIYKRGSYPQDIF